MPLIVRVELGLNFIPKIPWHDARMLAQDIPGAVLREIPDAGHMLIFTHPAELLAITDEWEASQH